MKLLIKNGRVVDPINNINENFDILIENGRITRIEKSIEDAEAEIYNAKNMIITPGLLDMHTHLREPGYEQKEKIATGTASAALGGFTGVVCMANTRPVVDTPATVKLIHYIAEKEGLVNVYPVAAITKGQEGKELTEFGDLKEVGVVALSDDGNPVMNAELMRRAMEYSTMFDLPILDHCEDRNLSGDGVVHEGFFSTVKGLRGIPYVAETVMIARDIMLAQFTGARLHIMHLSTMQGVELVERGKSMGIKLTAEVTPHHIALTENDIEPYNTNYKINPPLREEKDRKALIEGLKKGIIDVIASDHAPHTIFEKERTFDEAPFGIIGLETLVPLSFMNLVQPGHLSVFELIKKLTLNPARILNIEKPGVKKGAIADITVINPELELVYKKEDILSKGVNSPFIGKKLKAFPVMTIVNGKVVMKDRMIIK